LTLTGRRFAADDTGAYPEPGSVPAPTEPIAEEVRDVLAP
jgi:hypothetical protein